MFQAYAFRRGAVSQLTCATQYRRSYSQLLRSQTRIGPGEIRLLRGRRTEQGTLQCDLETFSLISPELPPFQAVSYAWGSSYHKDPINVGNKSTVVLESLHPFLHIAFDERPGKWWWIDSLCIDQTDDMEKSGQIPQMGTIFRNAEKTIVWLGTATEDSDQAMSFLKWLGGNFFYAYGDEQDIEAFASRNGEYQSQWAAVESLFHRAWWRRVWTVQESISPQNLEVRCGNSSVSRATLGRALSSIWSCHGAKGTLKYDAQWNRCRISERYRLAGQKKSLFPRPSLTATLAYLGDHYATNPRDRIYSLSDLVEDIELAGAPDYALPVKTVYANLVKSFVEHYQSLDIVSFATIFSTNQLGNESDETFPSWVPDWRVSAVPLVCPLMVSQSAGRSIGNFRSRHFLNYSACYSASLDIEPNVSFSSDLTELKCEGIVLDVIDGLTGLPDQESTRYPRNGDPLILPTSQTNVSSNASSVQQREKKTSMNVIDTETTYNIAKSIMRCLVLNRGDHYLNHVAPVGTFMQEFLASTIEAKNGNSELHSCFLGWLQANKSFHIHGLNLESLLSAHISSEETSDAVIPGRYDRQTFISRFHDTIVKMARRLVVSERGLLGTAPSKARKGDLICVLFGLSVPVILRPCAETDAYRFVGECYVDGLMDGDAIRSIADSEKKIIRIV